MTIGMSTVLRDSRLTAILTHVGNGAKLRIYDGSRPATGGTVTTLLAELTCGSPFGVVSGQVLTWSAITGDTVADATGTATWFRVVKSDGTTFCFDGSVGTAAADLLLDSVAIQAGADVNVTAFTITEANV